jgi:hypothetical protein
VPVWTSRQEAAALRNFARWERMSGGQPSNAWSGPDSTREQVTQSKAISGKEFAFSEGGRWVNHNVVLG